MQLCKCETGLPWRKQNNQNMLIHFISCIRDSNCFPSFWLCGPRWREQFWAQPFKDLQPSLWGPSPRPLQVQSLYELQCLHKQLLPILPHTHLPLKTIGFMWPWWGRWGWKVRLIIKKYFLPGIFHSVSNPLPCETRVVNLTSRQHSHQMLFEARWIKPDKNVPETQCEPHLVPGPCFPSHCRWSASALLRGSWPGFEQDWMKFQKLVGLKVYPTSLVQDLTQMVHWFSAMAYDDGSCVLIQIPVPQSHIHTNPVLQRLVCFSWLQCHPGLHGVGCYYHWNLKRFVGGLRTSVRKTTWETTRLPSGKILKRKHLSMCSVVLRESHWDILMIQVFVVL